jgi:hypothetical protein
LQCVVQDKTGAGQQTKPPDGATVEVLNQTPSLEEASDVKSDSNSTCQDGVKGDSHSTKSGVVNDDAGVGEVAKETDEVVKSKPLSLKDENKQSEAAATERDVAKEADEIVKSKPLSLREGDSQDRQPDSVAASGQISKETVQNSGTTLTGDNASPALKQEAKYADIMPDSSTTITGGVSTTLDNEPKMIGQDLDNHTTAPTELAVSTSDSHTAALSPSTRAIQDTAGVLPSAPALIDFSDDSQQQLLTQYQEVASVQPMTTTAAVAVDMTVEGTEDASRILYPRLDSIMQGRH